MPGYGTHYWAERTADNRRRSYPKFRGKHTADVVVIGGGLTGCCAAYALAGAGLDVVLLEANRIGSGSTAGSLGAILPEPDASFRAVAELVGQRVAATAWKDAQRSAAEFASTLKSLGVKTDLEPAHLYINGRQPADAESVKREHAARKEAGLEAAALSGTVGARDLATRSVGAIRLRDAATFDPVRASLGLAGAAEKRGARIFEQSRVMRTRFTRKEATVVLASGAIRTRGVVVATGEPGTLFGQLRRHVRRQSGFVVVTEPISAAMKRETGRRRDVLTEVGESPYWLRWLSDDRALFAGALAKSVNPPQLEKTLVQRTAQLMYEFSVRYPVISGLRGVWSWDVPVVTTPDGLPWIGPHRNYPFHFFAMAFGWHGDGLAWLAARAAVRHFKNETRKEDEAFGFVRHL